MAVIGALSSFRDPGEMSPHKRASRLPNADLLLSLPESRLVGTYRRVNECIGDLALIDTGCERSVTDLRSNCGSTFDLYAPLGSFHVCSAVGDLRKASWGGSRARLLADWVSDYRSIPALLKNYPKNLKYSAILSETEAHFAKARILDRQGDTVSSRTALYKLFPDNPAPARIPVVRRELHRVHTPLRSGSSIIP
jgi:hypothetical protein